MEATARRQADKRHWHHTDYCACNTQNYWLQPVPRHFSDETKENSDDDLENQKKIKVKPIKN